MSSYPSITRNDNNDNSSDDDDINETLASLQVRKPCDNECNVVKSKDGYLVETQDDDNAAKWKIKNLKPHEKSDPFKNDTSLIGEVVYGRMGEPAEKDTAVFAFKDPQGLECHSGKCKPDTQHARLHREMYDKCPEEEKDLVATGFSYQKDKEFVFNSNTFNDNSKPYVDKKRYLKKQTREAGKDAQEMIRSCTYAWNSQNCPKDWIYSLPKKNNSNKSSGK